MSLIWINGIYIHERDGIYIKIVWFVNEMYTMRLWLYVMMEQRVV